MLAALFHLRQAEPVKKRIIQTYNLRKEALASAIKPAAATTLINVIARAKSINHRRAINRHRRRQNRLNDLVMWRRKKRRVAEARVAAAAGEDGKGMAAWHCQHQSTC